MFSAESFGVNTKFTASPAVHHYNADIFRAIENFFGHTRFIFVYGSYMMSSTYLK